MDLGKAFHVSHVAAREFQRRLGLPVRTYNGEWLISFHDYPEVILVDPELNEIWRLDLQAQSEEYCDTAAAISRDRQYLALSGRTGMRILDPKGKVLHRIPHPAWYSFTGSNCFFDSDNRLWYVRPRGEREPINDLVIVEPGSGVVLFEAPINSDTGYYYLFLCPDQESVLVNVACGQDSSDLHLARLEHSGLIIKTYDFYDRTFVEGFAPGGHEFATGAHIGDSVKVHALPEGDVVGVIDSDTIFADDHLSGEREDEVGYQAIFLDQDHILADTRLGRMLLIHRQGMHLLGTVWPEGYMVQGYDERGHETEKADQIVDYEASLTSLHPAGPGRVLMVTDARAIWLLDVSPLFEVQPQGQ